MTNSNNNLPPIDQIESDVVVKTRQQITDAVKSASKTEVCIGVAGFGSLFGIMFLSGIIDRNLVELPITRVILRASAFVAGVPLFIVMLIWMLRVMKRRATSCPYCRRSFRISDNYLDIAFRTGRCGGCGRHVVEIDSDDDADLKEQPLTEPECDNPSPSTESDIRMTHQELVDICRVLQKNAKRFCTSLLITIAVFLIGMIVIDNTFPAAGPAVFAPCWGAMLLIIAGLFFRLHRIQTAAEKAAMRCPHCQTSLWNGTVIATGKCLKCNKRVLQPGELQISADPESLMKRQDFIDAMDKNRRPKTPFVPAVLFILTFCVLVSTEPYWKHPVLGKTLLTGIGLSVLMLMILGSICAMPISISIMRKSATRCPHCKGNISDQINAPTVIASGRCTHCGRELVDLSDAPMAGRLPIDRPE